MVGCFGCIGGCSKRKKRKDDSDTDTETQNVSDSTRVEKHEKVKTEKSLIIGETSGTKDPDEKDIVNEEKIVGPSGTKEPDEKANVHEEKVVGPSVVKEPDNVNEEEIVGPSGTKEPDEKSYIPHVNNARMFSYQQLVNATDNFKSRYLLGQGGFGKVYKGKLEDSGQNVAIKVLDPSGAQGVREFVVEVMTLSIVDHPNLVKLIGYCADKEHRLLVYEYMALGSLDNHLHGYQAIKKRLDWNTRINIAANAARGLEYLHDKIKPPIIYRDLKSSNVLLGENYHAKLSDFGLARVGPLGGKTHVSTRVMGTWGYCAPEYAMTGKLTFKSDMYSFGVLLLELLTGRKPVDPTKDPLEESIVMWAKPLFKHKDNFPAMADPALKGEYPGSGLYQAIAIAALCILDDTALRPLIGDVVTALDYLASKPYDPGQTSRGEGPVDEKQKKPEV